MNQVIGRDRNKGAAPNISHESATSEDNSVITALYVGKDSMMVFYSGFTWQYMNVWDISAESVTNETDYEFY